MLQDEAAPVRKKRQYKRRQKNVPPASHHPHAAAAAMATAASFADIDILHHDMESSEDDLLSPVSISLSLSLRLSCVNELPFFVLFKEIFTNIRDGEKETYILSQIWLVTFENHKP